MGAKELGKPIHTKAASTRFLFQVIVSGPGFFCKLLLLKIKLKAKDTDAKVKTMKKAKVMKAANTNSL